MNINTPKVASQSEQAIERINEKINSLYQILSPVIVMKDSPEKVAEIQRGLVSDLNDIEGKLTNLLDSILI